MKVLLRFLAIVLVASFIGEVVSGYSCEYTAGTGASYDFSSLTNGSTDFATFDVNGVYYFQICTPLIHNCSAGLVNGQPTMGCQVTAQAQNSLGTLASQSYASVLNATGNSTAPPVVTVYYYDGKRGGRGRNAEVRIVCSVGQTSPSVKIMETSNTVNVTYVFTVQTDATCSGGTAKKGGGLYFIIIFFALIAVYFIGGALYMKFARHAEGREIIPNVEFWVELPGLLKDGCLYSYNQTIGRLVKRDGYQQVP